MAFLKSSRYAAAAAIEVAHPDGRTVAAIALRVLPATSGDPYVVQENDRLDIVANRSYKDATRFWHIADANSELDARDLIKPGRRIGLPPVP